MAQPQRADMPQSAPLMPVVCYRRFHEQNLIKGFSFKFPCTKKSQEFLKHGNGFDQPINPQQNSKIIPYLSQAFSFALCGPPTFDCAAAWHHQIVKKCISF